MFPRKATRREKESPEIIPKKPASPWRATPLPASLKPTGRKRVKRKEIRKTGRAHEVAALDPRWITWLDRRFRIPASVSSPPVQAGSMKAAPRIARCLGLLSLPYIDSFTLRDAVNRVPRFRSPIFPLFDPSPEDGYCSCGRTKPSG